MCAEAGADVVVTDAHDAEGVAGVVGQFGEGDTGGDVVAGHQLVGDGQVGLYEGVDAPLNVGHLLLGERPVDEEVNLALLAFDVTVAAAFATEHAAHGLVEQVLGGMGRRKLFLVVGVEGRGVFEIVVLAVFHLEIFCKSSIFLLEFVLFLQPKPIFNEKQPFIRKIE